MRAAVTMHDLWIAAELERLDRAWIRVGEALAESGGSQGSPGEWIIERMDELETELRRRHEVAGLRGS